MKELFCLDCDYLWPKGDDKHANCPLCGSNNIVDAGEDRLGDFEGHYEGDFSGSPFGGEFED